MEGEKTQLQSMTVQGSLVGIPPAIYAIARLIGLELPDGAVEAIINGVMAIMAVISVIMTYVGRLRAEKKIV